MGTMTAQVSSEMHNTVTEELISARRLWMAVLRNAVEDWRNGTLRAKREAEEFLFDSKEDFEMVCTAAGLDSGDFRVRLLQIGRRVEMRTPFSLCFATQSTARAWWVTPREESRVSIRANSVVFAGRGLAR
jgi:hypothetical protein